MSALPPGSVIGILGGGQLGRMLAISAARLGFQTHIYSDASGPAYDVTYRHTVAPYEDLDAIAEWADKVDVVTYEFENVPIAAATAAAAQKPLRPGSRALEVAQDRLTEKTFINGLGIPLAPFAPIDTRDDLINALSQIGAPAILKTRRLGYDGKGQTRITDARQAASALGEIGNNPAILEGFVDFECEVSVLMVRGVDGQTAFYDIPLNTHVDGILATSTVPGPLPEKAAESAREIARKIAEELDYVGVLTVELFYAGENAAVPLVVNEIAPRVHNSGHWTIDACAVCQFENHIRAVAGWPIAAANRHSDAEMTNLIGAEANNWSQLAPDASTCIHLYGKRDARPGRKMGHFTRLSPLTG